MRIVFMGTPEFAVPSLRRLYEDGHEIAGVYTKVDTPKSRGMKVGISPVKEYALAHNLPIYQPASFSLYSDVETVKALNPELIVVVAYGMILPQSVLDIPPYGCVNVHASILPKFRGAAPIQRAILGGEQETGVTAMKIVKKLDAGDIIDIMTTRIKPFESSAELSTRLSMLGAELISKTVKNIADGTATYTPQDDDKATYAHMLSKDMSPIDWARPVSEIINHVYGLIPWPVATAELGGEKIKIFEIKPAGYKTDLPAGSVVSTGKNGIDISCRDGEVLTIVTLQAAGGKRMSAADYLRGHPMTNA